MLKWTEKCFKCFSPAAIDLILFEIHLSFDLNILLYLIENISLSNFENCGGQDV